MSACRERSCTAQPLKHVLQPSCTPSSSSRLPAPPVLPAAPPILLNRSNTSCNPPALPQLPSCQALFPFQRRSSAKKEIKFWLILAGILLDEILDELK